MTTVGLPETGIHELALFWGLFLIDVTLQSLVSGGRKSRETSNVSSARLHRNRKRPNSILRSSRSTHSFLMGSSGDRLEVLRLIVLAERYSHGSMCFLRFCFLEWHNKQIPKRQIATQIRWAVCQVVSNPPLGVLFLLSMFFLK